MAKSAPAPKRTPVRNPSARSVHRDELLSFLDGTLSAASFSDYCPNGLQVQGKEKVRLIVSGVTASLRFIEAAHKAGADAILVHHGYFWRGEEQRISGAKRARIARLLETGINLFAYHLPLDAHPELGNNVQLANRLGWSVSGRGGSQDLLFYSDLAKPVGVAALQRKLARQLKHKPLFVGPEKKTIKRIAWCTGGAQDYLSDAVLLGADAFVSGEISERTTHDARENDIAYFAAGHHATERYGVQALGSFVAQRFGIEHQFIDDHNPV